MATKVRIRFELDVSLPLENVWPDGDAPENPTVSDVYVAMHGKPTPPRYPLDILRDWDLCEDERLEVEVL